MRKLGGFLLAVVVGVMLYAGGLVAKGAFALEISHNNLEEPAKFWPCYLALALGLTIVVGFAGYLMSSVLSFFIGLLRRWWEGRAEARAEHRDMMREARRRGAVLRARLAETEDRQTALVGRFVWTTSILFVVLAAVGSWYTTRLGLTTMFVDPRSNVWERALPFILTTVAALLLIVFGSVVSYIALNLGPKGLLRAWYAILPMSALILALCVLPGVVGFGGDKAVRVHLSSEIAKVADSAQMVVTGLRREAQLIPAIEVYSGVLNQAARDERSRGAYSGLAGSGAVAGFLDEAALSMSTALEQLKDGQAKIDASEARINDLLGKVRADLEEPPEGMTFREYRDHILSEAETLRSEVVAMNAMSARLAVEAAIQSLGNLSEQSLATNPTVAAAQGTALSALRSSAETKRDDIKSKLDGVVASNVDVPKVESISPFEAIFRYWRKIWSAWLVQLCADLGVLPLSMLLSVLAGAKTEIARRHGFDVSAGSHRSSDAPAGS